VRSRYAESESIIEVLVRAAAYVVTNMISSRA